MVLRTVPGCMATVVVSVVLVSCQVAGSSHHKCWPTGPAAVDSGSDQTSFSDGVE